MHYLSLCYSQDLTESKTLDFLKTYSTKIGLAIGILGGLINPAQAAPELDTRNCGYNPSNERYECSLQDGRVLYVGKYDRNGREVPINVVSDELQRLYQQVINQDVYNNQRHLSDWEIRQLHAMQQQRMLQNQSRDRQRQMIAQQYNDHLMNTFVNVGLQFLSRRR